MTTQPTKRPVVLPFPKQKRQDVPRLFLIEFNHSKIKPYRSGRYINEVDALRHETQMRYGVLFPGGLVALDNGVFYETLSEMLDIFRAMGDVQEPCFLDEIAEGKE